MYHVQTTEEKINNFGYAEADVSTTRNKEEDIVNKSTLVRLRECYWNQRFSNYQKGIPITIES